MALEHWVPNHFVILLPTFKPLTVEDVTHTYFSKLSW